MLIDSFQYLLVSMSDTYFWHSLSTIKQAVLLFTCDRCMATAPKPLPQAGVQVNTYRTS